MRINQSRKNHKVSEVVHLGITRDLVGEDDSCDLLITHDNRAGTNSLWR
jgi:hypothetical protein